MDQITAQDYIQQSHDWLATSRRNDNYIRKTWMALFGATAVVAAEIWNRLVAAGLEEGSRPRHLLWALLFLRQYDTERMFRLATRGSDDDDVRPV